MPRRGSCRYMPDMRAYLDYNATAPLRREARAAVLTALDLTGNPSSIHAEGRAARAFVEDARREIAGLAGAPARDVVFCASGTEAANMALAPGVSAPGVAPLARLIVGAGEHPCVTGGHRFPAAGIAPLQPDGRLDLDALERLLSGGPPALVALQGANNETGVVQPVAEAARLVHAHGGLLICDAVQVAGRLPLGETGADALILSAHKFGGPKGAGALVMRREGLSVSPLVRGGGQERGRRAGTENVAALAGFGAAAKAALAGMGEEAARTAALRDACKARLREIAPDAVVFGESAPRLPNTLAFAIPDVAAATLLMRLDLEGAAVSSGSACSSGKVGPSAVLAAMGVSPALSGGAIRVSLGWASSTEDIEVFAGALAKALARRRA
jgi:cysteine desulfurase